MNPVLIPILSTVLLGLSATVFYWNWRQFHDEMFRNFFIAFALFTISRVLNIMNVSQILALQSTDMLHWVDLFAPVALQGIGSVFLVIGALNGSRRYAETPYVMLAAVLCGAALGAYYPTDTYSYLVPTIIANSVGNLFAAIILTRKWVEDKACLKLYRWLAVFFYIRVFSASFAVFVRSNPSLVELWNITTTLSIFTSMGIVIVGTMLARERARVRACQEGA